MNILRSLARPARLALLFPVLMATASGCSTLLAVRGQQELAGENAVVSGTVTTDHEARGPLLVGLLTHGKGGDYLLDYFLAEKPGPWIFVVAPGTYRIAAFEDANGNGRYDDEPALRADRLEPLELSPGERLADVKIVIPEDGRFSRDNFALSDLGARTPEDQQRVSLFARSVAGKVLALDDPRFDGEVASEGMWKYYDFILQVQPGIYFLEPYDPAKIPVLFVHGIGGTPRDFTRLIAGLDRRKFQPWVYYYPSGARLEASAGLLTQLFVRLREQYRFERAAVVAHSMGGLVSREFVLSDFENNATKSVRSYVTISSPLGGMQSAGDGVESSPIVIESWRGLAPGSAYLDGLYYEDPDRKQQRRRLPGHLAYHMMFGFHSDDSGDGVVALSSQLRAEAQDEAESLRGFDETHTGILDSAAASAHLNGILAAMP
jgi:pimeloyl-ACP methyl ester carboxylesterase